MKLLLVAATRPEIQQCLDALALKTNEAGVILSGKWEIYTCITGVGLMATTFALTKKLLQEPFGFVLQAGIGGLYNADQSVPLGSMVAVGSEFLADLGAEDREQYISIFDLGFLQPDEAPFTGARLVNPMADLPFVIELPVVDGITVHTVSGSTATIAQRYAAGTPAAESMEGAALHYVCLQLQVPFLQVRAISNYVIPRDRSSWQIGKAVRALNEQLIAWLQ